MTHTQFNLRSLIKSERAQTLPLMAVLLTAMIGMTGLVLDVGNAYMTQRKLQASTDAAALAGAAELGGSTAVAVATQYSGATGDLNPVTTQGTVSIVTGYPKIECLTTLKSQGMACVSPSNGNAVAMQQQVTIPLYFLKVIGKKSITLTASATAAMRGSTPTPYNVAIILDTTLSMLQYDSDCGSTQMTCALNGMQILLKNLSPCPTSSTTCSISNGVSTNSVDRVAIFTYPNVTVSTASIDYGCTTAIPSTYRYLAGYGYYSMPGDTAWSGVPTGGTYYTFPTAGASSYSPSTLTYQITPFLSDYRLSDKATTLNSSSNIVKAAGGANSCGSMLTPNYAGQIGTYYAGAIYAAQAALTAQHAANPGSQNVIIILSDGDANVPQSSNSNTNMPSPATSSGTYPSWNGQCGQGVTAAQYATAQGTRVYSVAYGSPQSGCSTDVNTGAYPNISPCQTMSDMASAQQYFFSDYKQTGSNSTCFSTQQPVTSLSQIFTQIASDLSVGRLIPDNTP